MGETTDQERLIDKERNQLTSVKIESKKVYDVNRGNDIDRQKYSNDLEYVYKESQRARQ